MQRSKSVTDDNASHIVEALSAHGLTKDRFITALRLHPDLLERLAPEQLLGNFRGIAEIFATNGIAEKYYLNIALRQPSLFYQDAAALNARLDQLAAFVAPYKFPVKEFLAASRRRPTLLTRDTGILLRNLADVVNAFAADGLTRHEYLRAVLKCPNILSSPPISIIRNIRGAVTMLEEYGELTAADYLGAALRNPNLFYATPATVLRKFTVLRAFQERGLVAADPPVLVSLLENPQCLFYSDAHIALRRLYVRVADDDGITFRTLFSAPRPKVERAIVELCGLDPDETAIPLQALINEGVGVMRYRKHHLRRALACGLFSYYELAA